MKSLFFLLLCAGVLTSMSLVGAPPQAPVKKEASHCKCKNCKCTPESHCGCKSTPQKAKRPCTSCGENCDCGDDCRCHH